MNTDTFYRPNGIICYVFEGTNTIFIFFFCIWLIWEIAVKKPQYSNFFYFENILQISLDSSIISFVVIIATNSKQKGFNGKFHVGRKKLLILKIKKKNAFCKVKTTLLCDNLMNRSWKYTFCYRRWPNCLWLDCLVGLRNQMHLQILMADYAVDV